MTDTNSSLARKMRAAPSRDVAGKALPIFITGRTESINLFLMVVTAPPSLVLADEDPTTDGTE